MQRAVHGAASAMMAGVAMSDASDQLYRAALAACEQGRIGEGIDLVQRALAVRPDDARSHRLFAMALMHAGRHGDALTGVDRAIAVDPGSAHAFGLRADILVALGRRDEAVASYDQALALAPDTVNDWCNRGAVLHELERYDAAIASFQRAAALAPDFAPVYYNRGNAEAALNRHEQAIESYDRALALAPDHADAHNNRGQSLRALGRHQPALASFEHALACVPDHPPALVNRAGVLRDMQRPGEALSAADKALAISPDLASAWEIRAHALQALKRLPEAAESLEHAATLGVPAAAAMLGHCSLMICDWPRADEVAGKLPALIEAGCVITPFALLSFAPAPALMRKSVEAFVRHELAGVAPLPPAPPKRAGDRIRLGYVSGDFGTHAVTLLVAGLIERHDRSRFDVVGISVGPQRNDALRHRVAKACSEFHELGALTDADAAGRIRDLGIDIAIDLTGYTDNARPGILARRPAPVQASYLGYLGTSGASFIDYILADAVALPFDQQPYFSERIVHLPDCFLVTDDMLAIAPQVPSRREAGLRDDAIVLCSFNNSYKFRAPTFDIWMRLLRDFENCLLWLLASDEHVASNLRREARVRGVDPGRLVFAPRMDMADHLARQTLADLFLDTLPYNAGATAAAALWAGVPILTAFGDTLVGRMAASMLHAVGLPELATADLAEYEAKARALVAEPRMLAAVRATLARNRRTHPLFDTDRSRRHIEAAYQTMWDIASRGERPRAFAVAPRDS
jgi:protein O-GlcNAc transferase